MPRSRSSSTTILRGIRVGVLLAVEGHQIQKEGGKEPEQSTSASTGQRWAVRKAEQGETKAIRQDNIFPKLASGTLKASVSTEAPIPGWCDGIRQQVPLRFNHTSSH
eukprot:5680978-Amphidinium_carterae.2